MTPTDAARESCDDEWDDRQDDICDCLHYEVDILVGIATCDDCGRRWTQTPEQIDREIERLAEYDHLQHEWNRPPSLWQRIRERVTGWVANLRRKKPHREIPDDGIPF
jgi:hypothetical protein